MRGAWIASAALLTACGGTGPVQCGACPGPGIFVRGMPEQLHHAIVTACLTGQACQSFRWQPRLSTHLPLSLPAGAHWSDLDEASVQIRIRTGHARWKGTATIHYRASGPSPCDCGDLHADVTAAPLPSRPG
jgi:hypothetical protein